MDLKQNFKKKVLSNGMTVILEKRDLPIVSVAFAVKAGGVNETLEEKGLSHFIEHLLYKGTPSRNSKKIAEEIEKNGGEMNGFTAEEVVAYWCKLPSDKLDVALDVLGDIVRNPLFDEKEIEKERLVIFEEMKMYKDNPSRYVWQEVQKGLYSGTLSVDLIGTEETMNSFDREKIVSKFKELYSPKNMVLCVVGDADFDEICNFVEKNFPEAEGEIKEQEFEPKIEQKIEERVGIDQANLVLAYHVPNANEEGSNVAHILNVLTAGGMSSRLFSEIREKRNLAYAVKGHCDINKRYGHNLIYVGTTKENVEKVKALILEEFDKISKDLGEEELQQAKNQLIGNHKISMEDSQTQMVELLLSEVHDSAEKFYDFDKEISEVSLEKVKEMASKVKEGAYNFFALVPK